MQNCEINRWRHGAGILEKQHKCRRRGWDQRLSPLIQVLQAYYDIPLVDSIRVARLFWEEELVLRIP